MFKIRASGCSNITTGLMGLTEKQSFLLGDLLQKLSRTDKQEETLQSLITKRDNLELPDGVKTYCKTWKKEQVYNRKSQFTSKYTDKGDIMEDNSIDFVAEYLGYGMLIKNEEHFENDIMTGTPDVILKDHLIDVKNSWDCFTFPLYETEVDNAYYWQAQVYMELTGLDKYKLIYILMDTPLHLIEREAYFWGKNNGYEELDEDIYNSFVDKMTYPDIDNKYKIKVFDIERNQEDIDNIDKRVHECRKYINSLN